MPYKFTASNLLILLSVTFTGLTYVFPGIVIFGMNSYFLEQGNYHYYFLQFFTSNFVHGGILHLAMNSLFIYYFGNIVEIMLGKKKYIYFFIFIVFFNGILLSVFASHQNTIGISGFALALLTYYTLELKAQKNSEYTGGITAIILNIGIGFVPGISLYGHLFGVIGGSIYYFFHRNPFSKQEVGFIKNVKKLFCKTSGVQPENFKKH